MGREQAWMFKRRKRRMQRPDRFQEHLYGPWESGYVAVPAIVVTDQQEEELLNSRVRGSATIDGTVGTTNRPTVVLDSHRRIL
jgi:hypothetical protein